MESSSALKDCTNDYIDAEMWSIIHFRKRKFRKIHVFVDFRKL